MTDTQLRDIALRTLDGNPTTLAELADGAVLVVNVASKCGLTPQYSALERLAQDYGDRGLTVVGVPCNQFMGQEPGTAEEIQTFCSTTYGVTFPLLEKTDVNGAGRHPAVHRADQGRRSPVARRATCSGTSRSSCSHPVVRWSSGSVRAPNPTIQRSSRPSRRSCRDSGIVNCWKSVGNRCDTWCCDNTACGWTTDRLDLRHQ